MNVEKEELLSILQSNSLKDIPKETLSRIYDELFLNIHRLLNEDKRVYIPRVGVLYRETYLNQNPRLSDGNPGLRYKIKLSAKAYKIRE